MDELTVLVVSGPVIGVGIRRALKTGGLRVVQKDPDVVLMAQELPEALDAIKRLRESVPDAKIVVLARSDRSEDLFAALRAGADGYLLASTPPDRLPHAIRGVVNGEAALPRAMTADLIREFRKRGTRPPALDVMGQAIELTAREHEVIERLRKQARTAAIASELGISEITVRRHISTAMRKLDVHQPQRSTGTTEFWDTVARGHSMDTAGML